MILQFISNSSTFHFHSSSNIKKNNIHIFRWNIQVLRGTFTKEKISDYFKYCSEITAAIQKFNWLNINFIIKLYLKKKLYLNFLAEVPLVSLAPISLNPHLLLLWAIRTGSAHFFYDQATLTRQWTI